MMKKQDAEKRIEVLRSEINHHRELYHKHDAPLISDEAYDSLISELDNLEKKWLKKIPKESPTQKVGAEVLPQFSKVKHTIAQWSYDNIFDNKGLIDWDKRVRKIKEKDIRLEKEEIDYCLELKIDGLKIILNYEKGVLVRGATRGDGEIGEDITHSVKVMKNVPLKLNKPIDIAVTGEAWMKKSDFEVLNEKRKEKGEALFANTRNASAGSLRLLDSSITKSRNIRLFAYALDFIDLKKQDDIKTQTSELKFLEDLGFLVNPNFKKVKNLKEIEQYYNFWEKQKDSVDYGIDGVVIKINSKKIFNCLGYTSKAPRGAIAYKFKAEQAVTIVNKIEIQIGRTGALTPVAHLNPVLIAGSQVARATLHNEDEIRRLGLKIGDTVIIQKAGDIIPEIISVLENLRTGKEKDFKMPDKCPVCGSKTVKEIIGDKEKSSAIYCSNDKCPAVHLEKMIHFASKKAMNIDGFGEKIVEKFLEEGLIKEIPDIYKLKKEDILKLPRFAEKSADNIIASIENSKKVIMDKLIFALGIRHVGQETAYEIAKHFKNIKDLYSASLDEFIQIEGIGKTVAESMVSWFSSKENKKMVEELLQYLSVASIKNNTNGKLNGKTFVFTGSLMSISRDRAKEIVKELGGKILNSISKQVDFLVIGDKPGSKKKEAEKLNVKTVKEEDFLKMIEN